MDKIDIQKTFIPVGAALAILWALSQVMFGAGTSVTSLNERVNGLTKLQDKSDAQQKVNTEAIVKIQTQIDNMKNAAPIRLDLSGAGIAK